MYRQDKFEIPAAETKLTPDIHGLIAWLEKQDGESEYPAESTTDCLICRFASAALGHRAEWREAYTSLPTAEYLSRAAYGHIWVGQNNYADALRRARLMRDGDEYLQAMQGERT
jgi:hypothetical protein